MLRAQHWTGSRVRQRLAGVPTQQRRRRRVPGWCEHVDERERGRGAARWPAPVPVLRWRSAARWRRRKKKRQTTRPQLLHWPWRRHRRLRPAAAWRRHVSGPLPAMEERSGGQEDVRPRELRCSPTSWKRALTPHGAGAEAPGNPLAGAQAAADGGPPRSALVGRLRRSQLFWLAAPRQQPLPGLHTPSQPPHLHLTHHGTRIQVTRRPLRLELRRPAKGQVQHARQPEPRRRAGARAGSARDGRRAGWLQAAATAAGGRSEAQAANSAAERRAGLGRRRRGGLGGWRRGRRRGGGRVRGGHGRRD
jgi:hypothetical protein